MKKHTMSLVMAAGLLGSVASPCQQSASSQPSAAVPTLRSYAHRVVLDVVVTDGKGRPVSGLSRSDFQAFEDGAPQTLRSFEIVKPEPAHAPATPLHLAPNTFSNMATPPQDGPLTVLLYDVLNTPVSDLPYAHAQLVDFLKKRQRGAPVAIFVLGSQLRMLQGFTSDQNALLSAVDERDAKMAQSTLLADPEHPYAATAEKNPGDPPTPDGQLDQMLADLKDLEATERIFRQQERLDLTDDAFAEIARFLAGFPGRKNLLWLSGSFPTSVLPSPNASASGTPNEFNDTYNYGERNKVAADLLAQSHVALYAVDIRGLQTPSAYNAGSNRQRPVAGFNRQFSADLAAQSTELANEHASLEQVARETGGRAFYNTNGLDEAMDTAMQLGGTYYTLSWSPTNEVYDGKLRSIRVAVTGGYQLEYRRSYYAVEPGSTQPLPAQPPAEKKASTDFQVRSLASAMQHGAPSSTQIQFVANVLPQGEPMPETPAERDRRKLFEPASEAATMNVGVTVQHFAVNVALFGNELTLQQVSDSQSTFRLLFNAAAFDADGRELIGAQTEVHRTLTADQQKKTRTGELRDSLEIAAPMNARTIMIGVMDLSSNRIGTLEVPMPPPAPAH
jgi:VWFA-related protein